MPFKFAVKFTLTILLRTKDKREEFIYMYLRLEKEIFNNPNYAEWCLDVISVPGVCKELLLYCPLVAMRKIVVGLVKKALQVVDKAHAQEFMLKVIQLLPFAKKQYTKNFAQYLEVLKEAVLVNPDLVNDQKIIQIVIKYLFNEPFNLPPRPSDTKTDIFLGYDHFQINDNEKQDLFYSDGKSASFGHIFQLLFQLRKKIPSKCAIFLKQSMAIEELLRSVDNKVSIIYFGKLYAHLMCGEKETVLVYMRKLFEFFSSADFFNRSRCYKIFTPFLLKKCELQSEILDVFLRHKFKQMKTSKYLNEIELFLNYVFNLCHKSREFQSFLRDQNEFVA